jgi:hypothetical protein
MLVAQVDAAVQSWRRETGTAGLLDTLGTFLAGGE